MLVIFSSQNIKPRPQTWANIFICLLNHAYEAPFANIKMQCQRWLEIPLILGRPGTQYVAMVTKLFSSYCGALVVESCCKEPNISDTNWLRYLLSSYLIKIWLRVWCHHWANLHILKSWISLKQREIFENSKQHFSSLTGYLFVFSNGFDRKDVIFIIVAL